MNELNEIGELLVKTLRHMGCYSIHIVKDCDYPKEEKGRLDEQVEEIVQQILPISDIDRRIRIVNETSRDLLKLPGGFSLNRTTERIELFISGSMNYLIPDTDIGPIELTQLPNSTDIIQAFHENQQIYKSRDRIKKLRELNDTVPQLVIQLRKIVRRHIKHNDRGYGVLDAIALSKISKIHERYLYLTSHDGGLFHIDSTHNLLTKTDAFIRYITVLNYIMKTNQTNDIRENIINTLDLRNHYISDKLLTQDIIDESRYIETDKSTEFKSRMKFLLWVANLQKLFNIT